MRATSEKGLYRYERKFVTTALDREQVEALIELHPGMFAEIFRARSVNNIYFDSQSMANFRANVAGVRHRAKCRIRWYGDLFGRIEKPVLEMKIKDGLMGRKVSVPLPPFTLDESFRCETLQESLRHETVPGYDSRLLAALEPALLNRYRRKYFRSVDGAYRITVDSDLEYYRIQSRSNRFLEKAVQERRIVIELKYDRDQHRFAEWITNHFPFRLTKNSKYVQGVENVHC